jgi:hypothetical protein
MDSKFHACSLIMNIYSLSKSQLNSQRIKSGQSDSIKNKEIIDTQYNIIWHLIRATSPGSC